MGLSPGTIYVPQPLAIENGNFNDNTAAFPVGWTNGGPTLNTNFSYDYLTVLPYEGVVSLELVSTATMAGISQGPFPVKEGQVWQIEAALQVIQASIYPVCQLIFTDSGGNVISGLSGNGINYAPSVTTEISNAWTLLSAQGTVPQGASNMYVLCYVNGVGDAAFGMVSATLLSQAIPYYLGLITSEYQNSPNYLQLLACLLQPFVDTAICAASLNQAFDIANAQGDQLDVLGVILGASRTLPFTPLGVSALTTEAIGSTGVHAVTTNNTTYMDTLTPLTIDTGANEETVTPTLITQGTGFTADFTKTHSSGVAATSAAPSAVLSDANYQLLLQAKVLFNQFNGQYQGPNSILWDAWQQLFPGGRIYITDNQNMTATIFCVGAFSGLVQQMITNGLIVPRCQGVEFTYEFATLPIFGFGGLNPAFINGFGIGNWAST